jgi:hypothetical protein
MNTLETALLWLFVTVLAVAVAIAVKGDDATPVGLESFAPVDVTSPRRRPKVRRRIRTGCAMGANRNPANAVCNGGRSTAWTPAIETPRNDYALCVGA